MDANPYAPPTSDVEVERSAKVERRRAWRVYAFFLSGLYGLTLPFAFATEFRAILFPDAFFSVVGLTGLFAFAYRKRVLRPRLWVVWAILLPVWDVLFSFVLYRSRENPAGIVATALPLLLVVPEYVALWRYGHSSNDIWLSASPIKR
jgi:hypothetical protein